MEAFININCTNSGAFTDQIKNKLKIDFIHTTKVRRIYLTSYVFEFDANLPSNFLFCSVSFNDGSILRQSFPVIDSDKVVSATTAFPMTKGSTTSKFFHDFREVILLDVKEPITFRNGLLQFFLPESVATPITCQTAAVWLRFEE